VEILLDGMKPARIDLVLVWLEAATTWSRARGLNGIARSGILLLLTFVQDERLYKERNRKGKGQHSDQTGREMWLWSPVQSSQVIQVHEKFGL